MILADAMSHSVKGYDVLYLRHFLRINTVHEDLLTCTPRFWAALDE